MRSLPNNKQRDLQVDVGKLCRFFGGAVTIRDRLVLRGHSITLKAVQKWVERGRVPGNWLVELSMIAVEDGRELRLSEFMHKPGLKKAERSQDAAQLMG